MGTAGIEHDSIVDQRDDGRSIDDGQISSDEDSEQQECRGYALKKIDDRTGTVGFGRRWRRWVLVLLLLAHR